MTTNKLRIQQEADRCVKCALCLPHCPTYQLFNNENESPRGRIAFMDAVAKEQLPQKNTDYLDHCLACGACERVCPSDVHYLSLLANTRALIKPPLSITLHLLLQLVRWPWHKTQGLLRLFRGLRQLRLHRLIPCLAYLAFLSRKPLKQLNTPQKTTFDLFTGCFGTVFETETLHATIQLFHQLGYAINLPKEQTCCGALHRYAGRSKSQKKLTAKNQACFKQPTLVCRSGCARELKRSLPVTNLYERLLQHDFSTQPHHAIALLHSPCTCTDRIPITQLLQRIPQLTVIPLADQTCCGAAGSYFMTHPNIAHALARPLLDSILRYQADYLITSNLGCRLQWQHTLRKENIEVMHPLDLLARVGLIINAVDGRHEKPSSTH